MVKNLSDLCRGAFILDACLGQMPCKKFLRVFCYLDFKRLGGGVRPGIQIYSRRLFFEGRHWECVDFFVGDMGFSKVGRFFVIFETVEEMCALGITD